MEEQLTHLLNILTDDNAPLPIDRLSELSDLPTQTVRQWQSAWPSIAPHRKGAILQHLGQLADEQFELTFESINRLALGDADSNVRRVAINNLWECEDPAVIEPILQALHQAEDEALRQAAAAALGRFIYLGEFEKIEADLLDRIVNAMLRITERQLESSLGSIALEALGYSSRQEIVQIIDQAYASPDEATRQSSLIAMGRSADRRWQRHIRAQLDSPSIGLRLEAVRSAGELELRETVPDIIERLDDVDDRVRKAAIRALGQLGTDESAEALSTLLEQTEDEADLILIHEALDYLTFVDGTADFLLLDLDEPEDPRP
jgi:HEAT repeat protein